MDEGALLRWTRGLLETKIGDVRHPFSTHLRSESSLFEFNLTPQELCRDGERVAGSVGPVNWRVLIAV